MKKHETSTLCGENIVLITITFYTRYTSAVVNLYMIREKIFYYELYNQKIE